ncbi:MotA/TolQ/ExbB proton channel family protein [bacterium]|nr:MotA/TolQ/ExbB proton channel family protein [bacterium]
MLSELVTRGGPIMYVLLSCSFVSLAIILERTWFWLTEPRKIGKRKLCCLLSDGRDEGDPSLAKNTFLETAALLREKGKNEELARFLLRESDRAYERATRHLSGLDTVVSIAPLLGILGTVLGIMKSFHALDLQHMSSPGEVGHGLAEAMITTASGLAIAVPTLVFYNLFHSLATRHASALSKLSEDLSEAHSDSQESGPS